MGDAFDYQHECDCAFDVSWEHNANCPVRNPAQAAYNRLTQFPSVNSSEAPDWFHNLVYSATVKAVTSQLSSGVWKPADVTNEIWRGVLDSTHSLNRLPEWGWLVARVERLEDDNNSLVNNLVDALVERNTAQRKVREYRVKLGLPEIIGLPEEL